MSFNKFNSKYMRKKIYSTHKKGFYYGKRLYNPVSGKFKETKQGTTYNI